NARRRVTPGAAQVLGHLNSGSEPPALARDDHCPRPAEVGKVIDLATFENRPAKRPVAAVAGPSPDEAALARANEQQNLHTPHHMSAVGRCGLPGRYIKFTRPKRSGNR